MSLLGVDVGTSALKAVAFDADSGRPIARARVGYAMRTPAPGWAELDPELVWDAFTEALGAIAAVPEARRDPPRALACSVSGDEIVLLDRQGRPLGPVILSGDTRGAEEAAEIGERLGAQMLAARTGLPLYPTFPLIRLLWYRHHAPELLDRIALALGWGEYLMARLGLAPIADDTAAARWLLFDLRRRAWMPEVLAALDLPTDILPASGPCGTPVGEIPAASARALGLDAPLLVVAGGFDQVCAAAGAGVLQPGEASVGTGTWETLTAVVDAPVPAGTLEMGYQFGVHVPPDSYAALGVNSGGGSVLQWLSALLGGGTGDGDDPTAGGIGHLVASAPERANGLLVLPHFQGSNSPWMDPRSRGAIVGLTWASSRAELVRAILEGITFELRANLEGLRRYGTRIARVRNTGGGARSPAWAQLKADVLGIPVETVNVEETGCLSAALLAGVGLGVYRSLAEPLERFVQVERRYAPRPDRVAEYDALYATYRQLYPALAPIAHALQ